MRSRVESTINRLVTVLLLFGSPCQAAVDFRSTRELAVLSLEQLANLQITTVSRKPERLADAPASIYVITGDEIRRSGATTLPEALRLAPNLQVARVSNNGYIVGARGINNTSTNKLLVLVDGRSVYSPLFSGVFWDVQDVMLEDVERIEIVSGPGGTLWGVNAVNGVINVITRSASGTQGGLLSGGGGTRDAEGALRFGGAWGSDGHYRIYGKYFDRDPTRTADGARIDDGSYKGQIGFRAEWERAWGRLMLQGNAYRGDIGQPRPGSISISGVALELAGIPVKGANLVSRWILPLQGGSEVMLQAYYDRTERTVPPTFGEKLDLFDVQFQHTSRWAGIHSLVWGAEYRYSVDRVTNSAVFAFLPAKLNQRWGSLFVQDEMDLRADLRLTVGGRLERNDYTGNEFLPNARLAWRVAPDHLLWSALSRTVRAPSRLDRDAFVPGRPPFLLAGGPDVRSEVARVFELGYRGQASSAVTYSVTVYHARYDDLHTQEIAPSRTFLVFSNGLQAKATGIEAWSTWQALPSLRLSAGFTAERERMNLKTGSNDAAAVRTAGRDPANTWRLLASANPAPNVELDITVRGAAALANPEVARYSTVDVRIGWRPRPGIELSLTGTNLGGGHGEFGSVDTRTEIRPGVFAGVRWEFGQR